MSLYQLIVPIGITTLSLLIITILLGLRTKIIPAKIRIKLHITLALITLTIAIIHSGIVLYSKL
jgi:hypothetical protein